MGRAETLARAATLDRPAVAYLHRFPGAGGWHEYALTWDQLDRTTTWVASRLAALGLERGHRAVLTFSGYEGPWAHPVMDAVRRLGVVYGTAEPAGWDHGRVRVLQRQLAVTGLVGLSLETVEALAEHAPPGELFATTPVLLVRPEAVGPLRSAGVDAGTLAFVGPALGIECRERAGVHVDGASWRLDDDGGRPVIGGAAGGPALAPATLALDGAVVTGPCACGSTDPRLVLR